jgi:predicted outer membrane protein
MKRANIWLAVAAVATLSGCGSKPAPTAASAPFVLPSAVATLTPALYMQLASTSSLFAIRASEIAAERGDGRTRDVARAIIADQGGVGSQLSFAGRRLDLLPSATLPEAQQADLERLRASRDIDGDYRRMVGGVLARALEAHRTFAARGDSPTLRPVAEMAISPTARNLDAVRR